MHKKEKRLNFLQLSTSVMGGIVRGAVSIALVGNIQGVVHTNFRFMFSTILGTVFITSIVISIALPL